MGENDEVNIDSMLSQVGDFGRYQIILMLIFSVINVLSGFHYFGQTFISIVPEHKCKIPKDQDFQIIASQCSSTVIQNETSDYVVSCSQWTYNPNYGYVSIVEEFDWVCKDNWKPAIGQSMFFIGSLFGSLAFGILADKIGRLHVLVASNMCVFLGNLITVFSKNVSSFATSRFIAGAATDSNFVMMYIIVMEYIRPNMRTFGLNICIGTFYCLSCMVVPWLAVALGNWKTFLLVISISHLSILSSYLLLPESAQWLISKRRVDKAIECFKRIAKINKRTISEKSIESLEHYCSKHVATTHHENLFGLLRTPKLRRKTLILVFKSMVMTLCYDAISRNVKGLGYSPFFIFTATSSTILPACLLIVAIQDRVGRKFLASASLFLSGIFTMCSGLIQIFIQQPNPVFILSLAMVSRLSVTVAYNSGAQYAVELIPTVVRGQGVSAIHVAGFAASFFSPQILHLAIYWRPSPEVILGILLVLGSVACIFLPETLNKTLPVTLKDGEEFGEGEGIFEFACWHSHTESTMDLPVYDTQK